MATSEEKRDKHFPAFAHDKVIDDRIGGLMVGNEGEGPFFEAISVFLT
jgi:hypothetical protein